MIRLGDGKQNGTPAVGQDPVLQAKAAHAAGKPNGVHIRSYRNKDRMAIQRLCCDTGFLGDPIDSLFLDRELFADLFTKPYLDHEPDWALVAESQGRVVGYLLGSVCRDFELALLCSGFQTTLKMVLRLAMGRYSRHPRSRQFIRWLLASGFREQPKHPRHAAHLHFDIERDYRGHGVARRLWEVFQQRLRDAGVAQCYGAFFSHPRRRPESIYARFGFDVFDRRRTTLFQPEVAESVDVVCVHKRL